MKDGNVADTDKRATLLDFDHILGLDLEHNEFALGEISVEVRALLNEREAARTNKDFTKSDELRDKIRALGYKVKDTEGGQEISRL